MVQAKVATKVTPDNKSKVSPDTKPKQVTYKCKEHNEIGKITINQGKVKRTAFKCEFCDLLLMPVFATMKLLAHGKSEDSVNHELRQVKYL